MKFVSVSESLSGFNSGPNASELHGLLTGWLCAGSNWSESDPPRQLGDWLVGDGDLPQLLTQLVSELVAEIYRDLQDPDFGFQLLLPDDELEISLRQKHLSLWCSGFLSGFGMTGRFQESELVDEVAEVFGDLARIAGLDEEVPEDEENEADLMEIGEYVRISALMVFTECANKPVH